MLWVCVARNLEVDRRMDPLLDQLISHQKKDQKLVVNETQLVSHIQKVDLTDNKNTAAAPDLEVQQVMYRVKSWRIDTKRRQKEAKGRQKGGIEKVPYVKTGRYRRCCRREA